MIKYPATRGGYVDDEGPFREGEDVVHVIPLGDAIEHEESCDCICCPVVEQDLSDGGIVVVHYACDGREQRTILRGVMN